MTPDERGQEFLDSLRGQGYTGQVGLHICTLTGEPLATLNADVVFPAASTIKVPLLLMALERAQSGQLDLNERLALKAADRVGGAGVLHELGAGLEPTLHDLLTLMIVVSDNTATNMVIDVLGVDAVNAWLDDHGCHRTRLVGKLQLPLDQQNAAQRRGERNCTTPGEQARLLLGLWRGEHLDQPRRTLALSILGCQQQAGLLLPALPLGADGQPLYRTHTKSGELMGVHDDVGLLMMPRRLCAALLSAGGQDRRPQVHNAEATALSDTLSPLLAALGSVDESKNGDI